MIIYKIDVLNELKKHGYNTYKIKKEKILQPGDILEYRKEKIWQDHIRKTVIRLYTEIYYITVKKEKEHAKIKERVYFTIQKIKNVKMKSAILLIAWLQKIVHNIKGKRKEKHLLKYQIKI